MQFGAVRLAEPVDGVRAERAEEGRGAAFLLDRRNGRLGLDALTDADLGRLEIDFAVGSTGWRGTARARQERIVRACRALRPGESEPLHIVDGTGGLGGDSWILAAVGARVTVVEQHPVIRALLIDGLLRARAHAPEVVDRIEILCGDARARVADLAPDVLYLDPMYPPRRKQALGDRRLRLLAALLAADDLVGDDAVGLVTAGLAAAVPRVVLKCPSRQRFDGLPKPNHSLAGRSTRFDVWLRPPRRPQA